MLPGCLKNELLVEKYKLNPHQRHPNLEWMAVKMTNVVLLLLPNKNGKTASILFLPKL
jgi:hypothetical protein